MNENIGSINEGILEKIIEEFSKGFSFQPSFEYKRKDNSNREIYIYKIQKEDINLFSRFIQNAKIILKVKQFEKNGKLLMNFDFSYEFFTYNNIRQGFSAGYYVYDVNADTFKEYKN